MRTAAEFIENRQPSELLEEVRRFARRRPGTFLLGAAAIGFLGGRLTRGIADEARDDSGAPSPYRGTPTAGLPANPTTGLPGTVPSPGGYGTTPPVSGGVSGVAPAGPGYSVTPENDPAGDATAQFTPTGGGAQADQMPSEFGARGTGAAGNRPEEDRI